MRNNLSHPYGLRDSLNFFFGWYKISPTQKIGADSAAYRSIMEAVRLSNIWRQCNG